MDHAARGWAMLLGVGHAASSLMLPVLWLTVEELGFRGGIG